MSCVTDSVRIGLIDHTIAMDGTLPDHAFGRSREHLNIRKAHQWNPFKRDHCAICWIDLLSVGDFRTIIYVVGSLVIYMLSTASDWEKNAHTHTAHTHTGSQEWMTNVGMVPLECIANSSQVKYCFYSIELFTRSRRFYEPTYRQTCCGWINHRQQRRLFPHFLCDK